MPSPIPRESRDDVVAVARSGDVRISEVAKDFGISESCLRNWLKAADVVDGDTCDTPPSFPPKTLAPLGLIYAVRLRMPIV